MPRPTNTAERRSQIVRGLLRAMAEHGYGGASIQAVARAAGLTAGLVHYHFESKQQILIELVRNLSDGVHARYQRRAGGARDPWTRVDAFIDAHLALGDDADPQAVACWVAIGAEALRQREVGQVYEAALRADLALLRGLVAAVLDQESIPRRHATRIAASLMAAVQGSYQLAALGCLTPAGSAAASVRAMARGLVSAAGQEVR
jgi:TetR/AcrR family transcriptional regulator, transcriptional repressor of bet genes